MHFNYYNMERKDLVFVYLLANILNTGFGRLGNLVRNLKSSPLGKPMGCRPACR